MTLIVTLSSIPKRFPKIGPVLESLVCQQGVDRIQLYLPHRYRRFPDWDGTLPNVPKGVEIVRTETDFGPGTKILPAARAYRGKSVSLLFCDDDHIYPSGWAARFPAIKTRHPDAAIALGGWQAADYAGGGGTRDRQPRAVRRWRVTDIEFQLRYLLQDLTQGRGRTAPPRRIFKQSGYVDVFEGYAGVLVDPAMFDDSFYTIPPVLWGVDDVWLSGCLAAKSVPIWLEGGILDPRQADSEALAPLAKSVVDGADRATANREGVLYFRREHGLWP